MYRYIYYIKEIIAAKLVELFIEKVFKDFSLPKGITLNRGSIFTSKF